MTALQCGLVSSMLWGVLWGILIGLQLVSLIVQVARFYLIWKGRRGIR